MRISRRVWISLAVASLLILIGGRAASDFYVQALWFDSLGYGRYFWRIQVARWLIGLAFGLSAGGFLFANLYPLIRLSPRLHIRRRYGNIEIAELFPHRYLLLGVTAIAVLFGLAFALYGAERWTLPILQYLHAPAWGLSDPIFGADLSFYVFTLPLTSGLHAFLVVLLVATGIFVLVGYALTGGVTIDDGRPQVSPVAQRHLSLLTGALLLLIAAGFWIGLRELLSSGHGVTGSLGYADVHARFTARRVLVVLSVLGVAATLFGAYRSSFRYGVAALITLILSTIVLNHAYPSIIQKVRVEPNELERERKYLAMNMEFTRMGFQVDELEERDYPLAVGSRLSQTAMARATAGLPLWDPRPLRATYNQFQGISPYYTFADVDYDRYGAPGAVEQVAIAVREIDIEQLPAEARTWQNLHLSETYTHGIGLVMSPAARIHASGEPSYYVSGLPPTVAADAPAEIELEHPQVYFGEKTEHWVLVRDSSFVNLPQPLGVRLNSFHRKLSFAWSLADKNLVLSEELRSDTRILYERGVRRRVTRLAPFLRLDPNVYPALADGRIFWIQDAYTTTRHFPLSARSDEAQPAVRYMRNSVKVTVDALTGAVSLYVVDPDDPLVASLQTAFPTLFKPLSEMPASLRRHLRYPAELLLVQAQVLQAYHVDDPRALYYQLDLWDIPIERYRESEEQVRPYYVVMPDPSVRSDELEYLLVFPLTARGRDNMRGLLVARSGGSTGLRVTLFRLPSEQVLGPRQVEVLIDQDPAISQQFTLWQQRGSRVIRGHLLVVPVGRTFLYVEPIFLEAESGGAAPSLKRVVAVTAGRVAMGATMSGALAALAEGPPAATVAVGEGSPFDVDLEELQGLILRADSALQRGDLIEFGRTWRRIRQRAGGAEGPGRGEGER